MDSPAPNHSIDYLEFVASDLSAAKTFLESAFGWKFTDYGPEYTSFHDGRISGGIRSDASVKAPGNPLVVIFSRNLEETLQKVVKEGGNLTSPPYEFPGGRRFEFTAPGGLVLAVLSPTRPDGSVIH